MICEFKDIEARNVENAQNGEGTVSFYDWPKRVEFVDHGRLFAKLVIPPGASIGDHQHEGEFEAYYVIKGNPTVNDNGKTLTLNPGDMHICETGQTHGTKNETDEDVELLAFILNDLSDRYAYDGPSAEDLRKGTGRIRFGDIVKHFKYDYLSEEEKQNKKYIYRVTDFVENKKTGRPMVIYQPLYYAELPFSRDYEDFISEVDKEKYPDARQTYRFEVVADLEELDK